MTAQNLIALHDGLRLIAPRMVDREMTQGRQSPRLVREELSMSELNGCRRAKVLSPETQWETFLSEIGRGITREDAARKWGVDVSMIFTIGPYCRRGCAVRPATERNWALEDTRRDWTSRPRRSRRSRRRRSGWGCFAESQLGLTSPLLPRVRARQRSDPQAGRQRRHRRRPARCGRRRCWASPTIVCTADLKRHSTAPEDLA